MPAMSKAEEGSVYEFGSFRLDVHERQLRRADAPVQLTPKAFELLVALVARRGRLVTKEELFQEVWAGSYVEEGNLSQNIYTLRKVLGEGAGEQTFIETVPKQGYRFVAPVRVRATADDQAPAPAEAQAAGSGDAPDLLISQQPTQPAAHFEAAPEQLQNRIHLSPVAPPFAAQPTNAAATAAPPAHVASARRAWLYWLALMALGLCVAVAFVVWRWRAAERRAMIGIKSIAVLPFKPLGAESNDELLGLGMADATIIKLSKLPQLSVLPTSAIYKYTGREHEPLAIGRELNVDAVLDGTVQHAGERVRVSVQLLRLSDGRTLWAGKFDEQFTDIFTVQDSLSAQVAQVLAPQLTGEAKGNLTKRYTNNTEAYEAYLRGLYFWNKRSEEGLRRSIEYFGAAVKLDPNYALAYAGLADSYALVGFYGYDQIMPLAEVPEQARAAAARALALDATLAEAHTAMAQLKVFYERNYEEGERELQRALTLNPNYATAHQRYSILLLEQGRIGEAAQEATRAHELDPLSAVINYNAGRILYLQRQYDRAAEYCRKGLEIDPTMTQPVLTLALVAQQQGRYDEAIALLLKANALTGRAGHVAVLEALGCAYAAAGRREEAARVVAELQQLAQQNDGIRFSLALVAAALGDNDRAFQLLEERAPHWQTPPFPLL
ncbi:MAG TPA: winged helix-turn-helix domain-containing protein, partial [Pyrinomonadaceae bacterium]